MATSTVRLLFLGDASSAVRSVNTLDRSMGGLGRTAGLATAAIGVGLVGGLVAATKVAISFDKEMRNVNSIAKLNERQFKTLSNQVRGLSKETAKAPTDLAKGLYDLVSSGFKANDAIKVLRVSAKAATAGMTDTKTAAKAVAAALNAYHLGASSARKVSDILFQTVNKGVLTFEELAQNIGDVVPLGAPLGISLEEIGAALATLTLQGGSAAERATQVKNAMIQLASPSKELKALFKGLGFESAEMAVKTNGLSGVLGMLDKATQGSVTRTSALTPEIRALMGVVGLTGKNFETYQRNLRAMEQAQQGAGATAKAFAEQGKSISFQWERAKASLAAAAIPLGQELFPLLEKGAGKVEDFANALPRLRTQIQPVVSAVGDLARVSFDLARTDAGQFGIITALSTAATASTATKIQGIVQSVKALPPTVSLAVGVIGLLAGTFIFAATRGDRLAESMQGIIQAANGLRDASLDEAQAHLRVRSAQTQVQASTLNLEQAKKGLAAAEKEYGKGSTEARQAANGVRQAQDQVRQSALDLTTAKRDLTKSERASKGAADEVAEAHRKAAKQVETLAASAQIGRNRLVPLSEVLRDQGPMGDRAREAIAKYGDEVARAFRKLGSSKKEADNARAAVDLLTAALGRIPTFKEVRIYVRTINARAATAGIVPGVGRAGGGFIPSLPGSSPNRDSVPAMLTPGEIVLNRSQQDKLGGPRFLADLFGFRGERGPGFAAGGVVGSPTGPRRSGNPTHRPLRPRSYAASSKEAKAVLRALTAVNQRQSDFDRSYGQLEREFSISREEFVVSDADGNESLDRAAIAQRLSEIGRLVTQRQQMLGLLAREQALLEEAIRDLEVAIERFLQAARQEREAARAEAQEIAALERQIRDSERTENAERAKKKPDKKLLASLDRDQAQWRTRIGGLDRSRRGRLGRADELLAKASGFRESLAGVRQNLARVLPLDRRDVELTIMELRAEASAIQGIRPAPGLPPIGDSGGGGGGGGGGDITGDVGGFGSDTQLLQDEIARLTEELGRLSLGVAVERRQLGIIGSFQRGTLHVPETGYALVHAGEKIRPAGVPGGFDATAGGPTLVLIEGKGDRMLEEMLREFVDVRVVRNTSEISDRMGRRADLRARAGGY